MGARLVDKAQKIVDAANASRRVRELGEGDEVFRRLPSAARPH